MVEVEWRDIEGRVDREEWNKIVYDEEQVKENINNLFRLRCATADLGLDKPLEHLWSKYAKSVAIIRAIAPSYVRELGAAIIEEARRLEVRINTLWMLGDKGRLESDAELERQEQLREVVVRHFLLLRQAEGFEDRL